MILYFQTFTHQPTSLLPLWHAVQVFFTRWCTEPFKQTTERKYIKMADILVTSHRFKQTLNRFLLSGLCCVIKQVCKFNMRHKFRDEQTNITKGLYFTTNLNWCTYQPKRTKPWKAKQRSVLVTQHIHPNKSTKVYISDESPFSLHSSGTALAICL